MRQLLVAAGIAAASPAFAQAPVTIPPAQAAAVMVYPSSFFADFRPINAFDMVSRIPGFTFNGGAEVRGLAGAVGNVLIDGERPSAKSVTLEDTLKRLTPQGVERIELIRGGAPGIDMQGQSVVANIIRRGGAEATAAIDGTLRLYGGRRPGTALRLEGARRSGGFRIEGALFAQDYNGFNETGRGIYVRRDGAGALLSRGAYVALGAQRVNSFNGAAEYRRGADTLRLTGGYQIEKPLSDGHFDHVSVQGARRVERVTNINRNRTFEVGGDYQHRFSPKAVARVIGLYTDKGNRRDSSVIGRGLTQLNAKRDQIGEAIVRTSLSITHSNSLTFELGGEGAFNYLDASNVATTGGLPVVLPSANVRVEERRAEGFATVSAKPLPKLSLEGTLRVETSRISQSGDATLERTFTFAKPRLIAAYALDDATQLRGRIERTVGQLDFADFAAAPDFNAGITSGGNANLEPERAWLAEIAVERRIWGEGAIVLTLRRHQIEQVVDVIPVFAANGAIFPAPGNIGDGRRDEAQLNLTLPTKRLGLRGGQLKLNVTARRSRVIDPTTHIRRPITDVRRLEGDATYTQDFPSLASTLTIESGTFGAKDRQYYISDIQTLTDPPITKVTWLYRPRPDLTLAFAIENVGSKERVRRRLIYDGPRSAQRLAVEEYRSSQLDPWISFRARKTY
jgi:outer membrane cobalamin receptor